MYVILCLVYNVLQPIGEAPDEPSHVDYILYVQRHGHPPVGQSNPLAPPGPLAPDVEYDQVPLYYLLLAGVLSPVWLPPNAHLHRNPFVGWPKHPYRLANVLHRTDERWPYHGLALFIHLGRLISLVFGLITLLATYGLVSTITGRESDALFATAWLGWTPSFVLAGARINNDAAAMAWSALTLLLCARLVVRRTLATPGTFLAVSLSLTAALLTKLHTLFLLPLVVVSAGRAVSPSRSARLSFVRRLGTAGLVVAGPLGLLTLWWRDYGRTFGSRVGEAVGFGVTRLTDALQPAVWTRLPSALWLLNATWWGDLGASTDTHWPAVIDVGFTLPAVGLAVACLYTLGAGFWRAGGDLPPCDLASQTTFTPCEARRASLVTILLVGAAIPLVYATITRQAFPRVNLDAHARFLLPVAPVLALVVTIGGGVLPTGRLRRLLAFGYLGGILGLAVGTAVFLLPSLSDPVIPARLASDAREASAPAIASYANGVDLLAVDGLPPLPSPGSTLQLRLRWQARQWLNRPFIAFVHAVSRAEGQSIASGQDEIPLERTFPPTLWEPGELIEESQTVALPGRLSPGLYVLEVGAYYLDHGEIQVIPVTSPSAGADAATIARWIVLPDSSAIAEAHPIAARFGSTLALKAFMLRREPSALQVSLFWTVAEHVARRFVVSVQLLDRSGRLIAQHDGEPVSGRLPTTLWPPGMVIRDDHAVSLAPDSSAFQTIVVVYDRETLDRLPVWSEGLPETDHLVLSQGW